MLVTVIVTVRISNCVLVPGLIMNLPLFLQACGIMSFSWLIQRLFLIVAQQFVTMEETLQLARCFPITFQLPCAKVSLGPWENASSSDLMLMLCARYEALPSTGISQCI